VVDGVQKTTVTSNLWSSTTGASRGDGEVRLEATAVLVVVGVLEKLREKAGQAINQLSRESGERGGARGEKGRLHRVRIDDVWRRKLRIPASDLSSPAASSQRGKGGAREGSAGLYRGGLEDHLLVEMKRRSDLRRTFPVTERERERD
jgi:hypothetical protein